MEQKKESGQNEKALDLAKRIVNSIQPQDISYPEDNKIICNICGCANDKNAGICKKCSNLLFMRGE